jgi:hypothetical protein
MLMVSEHFGIETSNISIVKFEVFSEVTIKNAVFWDVTPCDCCKN